VYIVEKHYLVGIPQTAIVGGLPSRGIACHWTAGGPGRRGALDTAQFFIDRADRNASYHELWWWDAATGTFGVLLLVPVDRAAHSMNPTPPTYAPNAEVRRILGDKVGDPNAACYAFSFAGMPADLERALADPRFRTYARRRYADLLSQETTIRDPRPLFNHGWAQPTTRTDAGERLIPILYGLEDDSMSYLKGAEPIVNRRAILAGGATVRSSPAFDRSNYDAGRLFAIGPGGSNAPAIAWVSGTNLTLSDGTVFDKRTRWLALQGAGYGVGFIHERDLVRLEAIETTGVGGISEEAVAELVAKAQVAGVEQGRQAESGEWTKLVRAEATAETALRKRAGL